MINLDIRTLYLAAGIIVLTLCFCMINYKVTRKTYRGFENWAIGTVLLGMGFLLIGLRNVFPVVVTIFIANTLIIIANALYFMGILAINANEANRKKHIIVVLTIATTLLYIFTYIYPSLNYRIAIVSIFSVGYFFSCAIILSSNKTHATLGKRNILLIVSFLFLTVFCAIRGILSLVPQNRFNDLMTAGLLQQVTPLIVIILSILITIGLIQLNSQMLEKELQREKTLLKENESRIRSITDSAQDAIITMDAQGQVSYWNPAAIRIFGYAREEAIGRNLHDLIAPQRYLAAHCAAFPEFQRTGHGEAVGKTLELSALTKAGKEIQVALSLSAIRLNDAWEAVGIIRDITESKQTEEALLKSREQYMLAVNGSNDGIWDWDLRDNSLFLSPKWKRMVGYEDAELPNAFTSFEERLHPQDLPRVRAYLDRYLKGEISDYSMEFRFRHRDGSYRWILSRGEALRDEKGIPYRMAGSHTDITGRKEAEGRLLESEALHRSLMENLPAGVFIVDPVTRTDREH